jgi:hypothetical protein
MSAQSNHPSKAEEKCSPRLNTGSEKARKKKISLGGFQQSLYISSVGQLDKENQMADILCASETCRLLTNKLE